MDDVILTWYQALQLVALGPCIFVLFFLCVSSRNFSQLVIPALYFLSLTCSFLLPLVDILPPSANLHGALLLGESLTPSLSFLLITQFISGRMPPLIYWSILAVPLIGGSSIVYATLITKNEICIREFICTETIVFKQLYEIFSGSLTFLLTIAIYHRMARNADDTPYTRTHKYALVFALIVLNLVLLGINLAQINGYIPLERATLAITFGRIGFIYLVLTSVFRVFDRSFVIDYDRIPHLRPENPSARDLNLADEIRVLLMRDKIYRDIDINRGKLAAKLAITEHALSRVINQCFNQNFTTLFNQYRVEEAKERLSREVTAITVIAFEVGFSSIPSFNRVFKYTTGMSPSEYRNQKKS